ncbi:MAG: threonine dehydratase, partial [Acidobacteria bacterium]|nr:threonine dehydratase [Acidobacteriota bacterium]
MERVAYESIRAAREVVYRHLRPTPLYEYPDLSRTLGCDLRVKHENHNPTGSFKIRGGLNLMASLTPAERLRGVVTATRGNHGQSVALAAKLHGIPATIYVPEGNNPEKNRAMESFGARLVVHGRDFDEARVALEDHLRETGALYVHPANEPRLIAGVGTYACEIFEAFPDPDFVLVPIGGGSGCCGLLAAAAALSPRTRIVGVQSRKAPAVYLSWKKGEKVETDSSDTFADGLATRVPFDLTFSYLKERIDDILLDSEEEIRQAILLLLRITHKHAEGAGAAA